MAKMNWGRVISEGRIRRHGWECVYRRARRHGTDTLIMEELPLKVSPADRNRLKKAGQPSSGLTKADRVAKNLELLLKKWDRGWPKYMLFPQIHSYIASLERLDKIHRYLKVRKQAKELLDKRVKELSERGQMPFIGRPKGVEVLVGDISPEAKRLGLNTGQLKTEVEQRLRKAGVRVLTVKECSETPGSPCLYVNIGTGMMEGHCAYATNVMFCETVTLASGFKSGCVIWQKDGVGIMVIDNITHIISDVGDLVDDFINDYLAATPK